MKMEKQMYVGGALTGAPLADVVSPATEEVVARVAFGGAEDAGRALDAAAGVFDEWAGMSIVARAEWMRRLRDALAAREEHLRLCVHLETGKTWAATGEDYSSMINSLDFYAEEISRLRPENLVDRDGGHSHILAWQPVGVVAAFLAWNFPLLNLAFKIGPAMAAGCPIVIKPSHKSPLSAYAVGEICADIGLPAGAVNILCGDDTVVGDALSSSTIPALLTLIGSSRTGRRLMEKGATSIKRFSMELGGNAPVLVFADADLDVAADVICALKFGNSGQICVAPNRVLVEQEAHDALRKKIAKKAADIKIGFARDSDVDMGPLIDGEAWKRVDAMVKEAVAAGAELVCGGGRPKGLSSGHYYAPTVLDGVKPGMRISREEIFGPVVGLTPFDTEAEALALANDTEAGLTAYVFTSNSDRSRRATAVLRFGEIQINGVKYGIDLPHGGIKQSGVGVDCSHLALHDYLAPKRISQPA